MLHKPVYVAVESFKFVRMYPLNNRDIPDEFKVSLNNQPCIIIYVSLVKTQAMIFYIFLLI